MPCGTPYPSLHEDITGRGYSFPLPTGRLPIPHPVSLCMCVHALFQDMSPISEKRKAVEKANGSDIHPLMGKGEGKAGTVTQPLPSQQLPFLHAFSPSQTPSLKHWSCPFPYVFDRHYLIIQWSGQGAEPVNP